MNAKFLFTLLLLLGIQAIHAENHSSFAPATRCLACDVPNGLQVVSVSGDSATLSWSPVPGATQYFIEVEDEQNQPSTFYLEVPVQDTFYVLNNIQSGVLYKFKVRTHCVSNQSDWSNWLFFNGTGSGGPSGGSSGSCSRPTFQQVTNLTMNSALLTWNPAPGVNAYTLEIEKESPGAPWQTTIVVQTNSFMVTGLDQNTRYKFKVRSNCPGGGHSSWTKWRKFKTPNSFTGTAGGAGLTGSKSVIEDRSVVEMEEFAVEIMPNPATTEVLVRMQTLIDGSYTLLVFDLSGRPVLQRTGESVAGNMVDLLLPVEQLNNGCYLLQLNTGAQTRLQKLVVTH